MPDFLAISFNAHDYAGHNWGPDSWEVLDTDAAARRTSSADLFDALDARVGKDGWAVDRHERSRCDAARRARAHSIGARAITQSEIAKAADHAIAELLGGGPWVARSSSSNIYMTPKFLALPEQQKNEAYDAADQGDQRRARVRGSAAAPIASPPAAPPRRTLHARSASATCRATAASCTSFPTAGSVITEYKTGTAPRRAVRRQPPGSDPRQGAGPEAASGRRGSLLQVAPTIAALLGVAPPAAARRSQPLFGLGRSLAPSRRTASAARASRRSRARRRARAAGSCANGVTCSSGT